MSVPARLGLPIRIVMTVVLGLAVTLGAPGCGSTSSGSTTTSKSAAQVLDITVKGNDVEPENKRVEVDMSEPLTLRITSDRAGELHVHSSPEQHVEFGAGTTTKQLRFTVPGLIELEEHKSDSLIAQLEVR